MPFIRPASLPAMELFPGAQTRLAWGESIMLSFIELAAGAEVPEHRHPHEQAGLVLSGRLRFRIGAEERVVGAGEAFVIPPDALHWGIVEVGPVRVLDVFSPPRADYRARYERLGAAAGDPAAG